MTKFVRQTHTMLSSMTWEVCAAGAIAVALVLVATYIALQVFRSKAIASHDAVACNFFAQLSQTKSLLLEVKLSAAVQVYWSSAFDQSGHADSTPFQ